MLGVPEHALAPVQFGREGRQALQPDTPGARLDAIALPPAAVCGRQVPECGVR